MSTAAIDRAGSGARRPILSRRLSWAVLGVVVIVTLAIGSVHRGTTSDMARINYLESVIKCPPCADVSIAQSDATQAKTLRTSVTNWVHDGWSDARIENTVVGEFGSNEILQPAANGIDVFVWIVPLVALVIGAIGIGLVLMRRRNQLATASDELDEALVRAARDGWHNR